MWGGPVWGGCKSQVACKQAIRQVSGAWWVGEGLRGMHKGGTERLGEGAQAYARVAQQGSRTVLEGGVVGRIHREV